MVSMRRVVVAFQAESQAAGSGAHPSVLAAVNALPSVARNPGFKMSLPSGQAITIVDLGAAPASAGGAALPAKTLVPVPGAAAPPLPTVEDGLAQLGRAGAKLVIIEQPGGGGQSSFLFKV